MLIHRLSLRDNYLKGLRNVWLNDVIIDLYSSSDDNLCIRGFGYGLVRKLWDYGVNW